MALINPEQNKPIKKAVETADFAISKNSATQLSNEIEIFPTKLQASIEQNEIEELDIITQAQQYVIESYEKELKEVQENFEIQDDKDGLVNEIWNGFKELTGLGISKSEVSNAIEKQEEIIEELKQARINGNFAEVYEKITGNKFDEEKLYECHKTESELEIIHDEVSDILSNNDSDEVKQQKINEYLLNYQEKTGQSFEQLTKQYQELSSNYLGGANELTNVLNSYVNSQEGFIDKAASVAQIGGMVSMVIGGVACFIPGGQVIGAGMIKAGQMLALGGTFGDNVAELIDTLTNEQNFEEDKEKYKDM